MKLELKRISIWPTIKISFVLNLVFGFVVGCFYALFFAAIAMLPSAAFRESEMSQLSGAFGAIALFLPFIFAFFAAIVNTILAFVAVVVYNFAARTMGGMELEFAKIDDPLATRSPNVVVPPPIPPVPPAPETPPQAPYSPYSQKPAEPPQDFQL